jgi:hypothetical protein
MAICCRDFGDGRICRERAVIVDTRPTRDESGCAKQLRVVDCPSCGLRLQMVSDEGPTEKRYVVKRMRDTVAAREAAAVVGS